MQGLPRRPALPVESGPRPHLLPPDPQRHSWNACSRAPTLTITCSASDCRASASSAPEADGIFSSGQIDLSGDGQPETVLLKDHTVSIFQDGEFAWQSPPEWQVLDVALGDPNNNGPL